MASRFFAELKRRNVYKVAIGYGVVAWLLIQAASFPRSEEVRARGYGIFRDADRAIPLLERVLHETAADALTPAYLRVDPLWDGIRNDPRFQKLANAKL